MKITRLLVLSLLFVWDAFGLVNASVKDLPVLTVDGRSYHHYEVSPKETVYTISKRLGISKEDIVKYNPKVADGLRSGMVLVFPVDATYTTPSHVTAATHQPATPSTATTGGATVISHFVERGETLYGLSGRYGISIEEIIHQNPAVANGLKAGQTLHLSIPANGGNHAHPATTATSTPSTASAPSAQQRSTASTASTSEPVQVVRQKSSVTGEKKVTVEAVYVVKKKETFYSIANAHGVTVAELEAANPGVTVLREGQVLNIPAHVKDR